MLPRFCLAKAGAFLHHDPRFGSLCLLALILSVSSGELADQECTGILSLLFNIKAHIWGVAEWGARGAGREANQAGGLRGGSGGLGRGIEARAGAMTEEEKGRGTMK